ncbi:hypothetical protein EHI8A_024810 [Entamoeba histolytica HM-1:IMSS-B]|uniref:Uncharacterized protein n=6 Tax=Entamoeba histolytica TaxID=5759 RepID=C4LTG9_ENTH1|nr:hypothetical protein EHI_045580 [Entamoeba histolytica HM-1:IMSS]EMD45566.1 Hypothetical protein EHI5A_019860 [Entamoeba histolytica KU27]EMH77038.1 hypothetical protein EHI8A_024810 [Entamoeba histolytica HM-1:IMSS-B]EMS16475.1 hypothetical protein KM1_062090 [Entamoeba histolytica HM-3:IMSS]ENY61120.1 hypothetical protein EHI7A_009280 [Entamoeba histolytica HM-1:IMSS-A]GAT91857.1 hypothetical protein CL6EHI_045580 [Entamoeba histolytica]|eukprot:XP_653596.1 hypothetical protein EHI_045580 [Entamoeba histolytica HM-1:IMSS]
MEDFGRKPRSKTNSLSQRELKQESKSWEAIQQSILMYLLIENGYIVTIDRPDKFAHLSKHFFVISSIKKGINEFKFCEEIGRRCQNMTNPAIRVCQQKQLKRHFDKSKSSLCVNLLIEFAQRCGYNFTIRGTRSSIYTVKMQKFCEISKSGKTLYNKEDIFRIGSKVNDVLKELCVEANGKECVDISYSDMKKIDENENSVTTDEIVSRSTSRGEFMERTMSAFKRVGFGSNYVVLY